jgi:hypothetical protein
MLPLKGQPADALDRLLGQQQPVQNVPGGMSFGQLS